MVDAGLETERWVGAMLDPDCTTTPEDARETLMKIVAGFVDDDALDSDGNTRSPEHVQKTLQICRGLCTGFSVNPNMIKNHAKWRALTLSAAFERMQATSGSPATKARLQTPSSSTRPS